MKALRNLVLACMFTGLLISCGNEAKSEAEPTNVEQPEAQPEAETPAVDSTATEPAEGGEGEEG